MTRPLLALPLFALSLFASLLLVACTAGPGIVCNEPYLLVGQECCLDSDANAICDRDEGLLSDATCPELDCSLCPAQVVEKEVEVAVTRYVCEESGEAVDDPADCEGNEAYNAFAGYQPYTGAEERSVLDQFQLRTACRDSRHAIELHYASGSIPGPVTIQVKEAPGEEWRDLHAIEDAPKETYLYGVFCAIPCTQNADFFLDPGQVYLLRARFDFTRLYDEMQYSNEYLVDAREEGEYLTKLC